MTDTELNTVLLALGKAQVDAMFRRQEDHILDDSEFLPMLETVLTTFETTGIEMDVAEELREYAFAVYDRSCKEAEPTSKTADNRKLMQGYLLGPRGPKRKPRR